MEEFKMSDYAWSTKNDRSYILRIGDNSEKIINGKGVYEPHLTSVFKALLSEGDNAIDLGANIGYHTIELSKLVGKGKIIAAEPLREVYFNLCANLLLNKCLNVEAVNKVCTNDNSSYVMEDIDWANSGNCKIKKKADVLGEDTVSSFTLDEIDIPTKLIKMDVQGSECNVIVGGEQHISAFRPYFVVEIEEHHLNAFDKTSKDLLNMFIDRDYVLYRIMTDYPCDHVAVPKEKDTFDFKQITGYDVVKIDKQVKETTIRWPLYDKAIY